VALFFARWVTHFCAPVFFLLTGTGAYLSLRKRSIHELALSVHARALADFSGTVSTRRRGNTQVDLAATVADYQTAPSTIEPALFSVVQNYL
jgi:hypothetical protein